ncbi:DUF1090 domain-containing protein [Serratia sp. UGAL515B_01]|uniref:DUF1090 domain-containing protein n=1 Tax=Serratia sp. UGAL515B_01 TaxID=2986763 RepID=UPI0029545301|nr:DUF1090 domain-containing protein [Serratia sp. UGAL515B_01]WON76520.1 DUF1090 domain-containing protein [Serratia sp. UGAL515B_01]
MIFRHFLLVTLSLCTFSAFSSTTDGCTRKAQKIQTQIDYATQHGNNYRVQGLKKALSEVQSNCTEAGLKAERQKKIAEKQNKVAKREQELKEVQQSGRQDKIASKQQKLSEAQAELKATLIE